MEEIVRLDIDELKPNMILAENLVTPSGMVVLSKNTKLNDEQFNRLTTYKIKKAIIFSNTIDKEAPTFSELKKIKEKEEKNALTKISNVILNATNVSAEKTEEFRKFAISYDSGIEDLKNKFSQISISSGSVQVKDLYEVTNNIINSSFNKSDVFTYLRSLKVVDDYTYSHCINVSILCNLFGRWLDFNNEAIKDLTIAGILHDIGKANIDPAILNKNAKLTSEEFELVKKHPTFGYEKVINNSNVNSRMKAAILMHHERVDGSGYPLHLSGDMIDDFAKVIAICDVFDAMISDRPYRIRLCPFDVIRRFERDYYCLFDTKFLFVFLDNIAFNYIGAKVKLSNAQTGEVVFINNSNKSKPIVKVDDKFINLAAEKELRIVKVI